MDNHIPTHRPEPELRAALITAAVLCIVIATAAFI